MSLLDRAGVGTTPEPHPRVQVKVGKSQRAALTVDVESGTVTVTKRGSGSPEEVIPQDKSKGLLLAAIGLMLWGWATCPVTPPVVGGEGHHAPLTPIIQSCS